MTYNIYTIAYFDKQFKHLSKKYPSLKSDLTNLIKQLQTEPLTGTPLGNDCHKIRLKITSKGRGKSAGARVITYVTINETNIYLLSIYDKSEQSSVSDAELLRLLDSIK